MAAVVRRRFPGTFAFVVFCARGMQGWVGLLGCTKLRIRARPKNAEVWSASSRPRTPTDPRATRATDKGRGSDGHG